MKARIRALLAKTPARGCTEAEALLAAEKALELMRQHGLTEDLVAVTKARLPLLKKWTEIDAIWPSVAYAARCRLYTETGYQGRTLVYLGCDPWPEIAEYLHGVIAGAAARASREFAKSPEMKRRRTARTKTQARKAFMAGFAVAMSKKLLALIDLQDPTRKRDLDRADKALDAEGPMKTAKARKVGLNARNFAEAYYAGARSGRETNVSLGMRGSAAPLALPGGGRE
ncbi:DUF7168 domain-containing protein [Falsiroseomonas sp.]|uniref:DUF7168 domain-containing protein n=1 Tax=Falsiroseomonas sp. TaxID=2870721 RepID=UPI003F71D640